MKKIAFLFTQPPHGSSAGREGLDAVLAASALCDDISLYFIADGVFQLLPHQAPEAILARDYIATFGILSLYDIDRRFVCTDSLKQRGLAYQEDWVINFHTMNAQQIAKALLNYDIVLRF